MSVLAPLLEWLKTVWHKLCAGTRALIDSVVSNFNAKAKELTEDALKSVKQVGAAFQPTADQVLEHMKRLLNQATADALRAASRELKGEGPKPPNLGR